MKPAGYLLNTENGPDGESGLFYDYILAENGLFIRAQNPLLKATALISPVEIRGLAPLSESIVLTHGKIPEHLYDLAISILMANSAAEQYLGITWENEYHLLEPWQVKESISVKYETLPSRIMDIHSHGHMRAFFSSVDNSDEQGLRLYMVVGKLNRLLPEVELRLGVYGYFAPVEIDDVFDL